MLKQEKPKIKIEGSVDDVLRLAYGGKTPQKMEDGGMIEGPSHEQGGVDVYAGDPAQEEPIAEVEGGERIFSVEDTQMLEQAAMQIIEMMESGQEQQAQEVAMQLGFAVVDMIAAQEQNQAAQEQGMQQGMEQQAGGVSPQEAEAMNQFGPEQPMI